ncbi:S1 RNA binding domain protein [Caprobacter fermentans]|uniref:30S ribosomal protein S1 n=1 Tax=Caproicibacter fermentans TaxID=2576756 RepID=A0A6N8I0B0_9FIRM|nr:S1 RNA-binding domain-containing protein [Caproicibacter fermentans]MVB11561.1 S1 RNA binding domain protein [Caproicibacter fermentans]OCN02755.1 RNA-binding protein [Clostridium sp. W14A]QNK41075.1 30S ribosomal protein S1 [Caproicibacter fermentans]
MFEYYPEGWLIDTPENRAATQSISAVNDACRDGQILEGRALVCDSSHNLLVDLGCMKGMIPREEGALGIREGTTRDIAIISRVNRPVCFLVTGFEKKTDGTITAILSRRAAQEKCMKEHISNLIPGDVIDARITHLENFGAFADIGCGIVALLPIDAISVSRIDHPRERFTVGMDIRTVIKSAESNRITLSHKELLGTWEENVAMFSAGETVAGIVRSVEPYGIFVELSPNLAGLAETKEDVFSGQQASVYIKSILPARMKVKLVIIDTFDFSYRPTAPKYFFSGNHLDRFVYSPPDSEKEIATDFNTHSP